MYLKHGHAMIETRLLTRRALYLIRRPGVFKVKDRAGAATALMQVQVHG